MHTKKNMYKNRRIQLLKTIKESNPTIKNGNILLIAGFENQTQEFKQESSFYYLTGITEPGVVLTIDLDGREMLYVPLFDGKRSQWVSGALEPNKEIAQRLELDEIVHAGEAIKGYTMPLLFSMADYQVLITALQSVADTQGVIFTLMNANPHAYVQQKIALDRLKVYAPRIQDNLKDISSTIAAMRRTKSKEEIELLYKAIEVTIVAQQGAACSLEPGMKEYEIRAGIEYIFNESDMRPAFPSIVASGPQTVVLHATPTARELKNNDLVVIDIGAQYNYYCADLTRTYPVSGTFTKRQREVYNAVLDMQDYIASIAGPGLWLNNKKQPDRSLHHLAVKYLEKKGLDKFFVHGIGHYLGIDVHDVGDYEEPLKEGDVITIEPGVYIPQEGFGVRIEDDYWIIKDGVICLSEDLPKDPDSIEEMAQADFTTDEDEEEDEH